MNKINIHPTSGSAARFTEHTNTPQHLILL
jgi:hypothetical protein